MNIDILVNKQHLLTKENIPDNLITTDNNENNFHNYIDPTKRPEVCKTVYLAFLEMQKNAADENIYLIIDSGYRSYEYQEQVYNKNLLEKGLEHTKKYVALPGSSEHQTGLAIDIAFFENGKYSDDLHENTKEFWWLIANCYKYGFILRYPTGKESITGYNFEPWHYRFVGQKIALEITNNNLTLEEYHQTLKRSKL